MLERLRQDSYTSSRLPSSDAPHHQRRRRQPSGRRPCKQSVNHGQTRTLTPVEEANEVIVLKPVSCTPCTQPVDGDDSAAQRQQVIWTPPLRPSNHGIPNASADLSGLWHHDPRGMARRGFKRDDRFMGPSHHRVVEGDISLVEADHATATGRPVWPDKRTI